MEAVEDFKQDEVANIPNSLLISAAYIGKTKKVSLKFYNPESEKIYIWEDKTGHQPYCFSKMAPEDLEFLSERDDVIEIKTVKKIDTLKDKEIPVSKIIVTDPLAIGGTQTTQSIRNVVESWESDIKYYENYLYDNSSCLKPAAHTPFRHLRLRPVPVPRRYPCPPTRVVAQVGSAPRSGRGGRGFKSRLPDHGVSASY